MKKYLQTGTFIVVAIAILGVFPGSFEAKAEEVSVHPADINEDWQLVMSEAIAYLAGWQGGSNPMSYAIRATYIWQNGGGIIMTLGRALHCVGRLDLWKWRVNQLKAGLHDSNPCIDSYDAESGDCVHTQIDCDDGDECTIDSCDPRLAYASTRPTVKLSLPVLYMSVYLSGFPTCVFMCAEPEE